MNAPAGRDTHRTAWALLLALGASLFLNQYLTLGKLRDVVAEAGMRSHISRAQGGALDTLRQSWLEVFTGIDYLVLGALLVLVVAMLIAELRGRHFSRMLADFERRPAAMFTLTCVLAAMMTRYYLNRGAIFMGDATMHIETAAAVAEHLRQLSPAVWSNYWYGGFPLLEFYAPLYFYLTGAMTLLVGDVYTATKLFLWLTHVGSILTMYLFLTAATARRSHALLGALAYGLAFHHLHILLYRGDLHLSLIYLLYPLLFLHLDRYVQGDICVRQAFVRVAVTAALLIVSHHAYAFFGLVFFALYCAVRIALVVPGTLHKLRAIAPIYCALTGAALMCVFLLVPAVLDREYVRGMPELPFAILIPTLPAPPFVRAMLEWKLIGDRANIGYLGLSVAVFALLGIATGIRRRHPAALALTVAGLYAFCTLRSGFQYNVKNMNFVVFYAAALCGFAPAALESLLKGKHRAAPQAASRAALLMITLVLLDLGPTTFQSVFRETEGFKQQMYARIRARDPAYKVIERQLIYYQPGIDQRENFDPKMLGIVLPDRPLATPFGWVHEAAGRSFAFNAEATKQLQRELHDNAISERSLDSLMIMGVKFISFRDRTHYYSPPLPASSDYTLSDGLLELRHATPLIAAPRLAPAASIAGFDPHHLISSGQYFDTETFDYESENYRDLVAPILAAMQLDRARGVAAVIPVLGDVADATADAPAPPDIEVLEYSMSIDEVSIEYTAGTAGFAQLAYTYFPYLDVRIDNEAIPFRRSAINYLVIDLPAGAHTITVRGRASPLRRWSFFFSLVAIAAVLLVPAGALTRMVGANRLQVTSMVGGKQE